MIIGIAGKKRHGKDTFARMLIENKTSTNQYVRIGFADPLRKIGEILGFTYQQMAVTKNEVHPLWNKSWRKTAQIIGTDLMRDQFDSEIWIKLAEQTVDEHPAISFIFTDVRYNNEAEFVKKKGGIIFQMIRSDMPDQDNHKSERGIDCKYIDEVISNFGTLTKLEMQSKVMTIRYKI